nr:hypothetical protein [Tanacetum cinerariifolium]
MSSSSVPTDTKTIISTEGAQGSPVFTPSPDNPYMVVRHFYSLTDPGTEFEPFEDPSAPPSLDYPRTTPHAIDESETYETFETRVTSPYSTTPPPTLSPGYSTKLTKVTALSPSLFCKRYRGTYDLIADTKTKRDESKDEVTESESEEAASEDQQQQAVSAEDTAEDEPLGLGYRVVKRHALEQFEDTVPSTYKHAADQREMQELKDHLIALEQRMDSREE